MKTNNKNISKKQGKTNQIQGGCIKRRIGTILLVTAGLTTLALAGGTAYYLSSEAVEEQMNKKPTPVEVILNGIKGAKSSSVEEALESAVIDEVSSDETMQYFRNIENEKTKNLNALITTTTKTISPSGQFVTDISYKYITGNKVAIEDSIKVNTEEREEQVELKGESDSDEVVSFFTSNSKKKKAKELDASNDVKEEEEEEKEIASLEENEAVVSSEKVGWVIDGQNSYAFFENQTSNNEKNLFYITPGSNQIKEEMGSSNNYKFEFMQKAVNEISKESLKDKNLATALTTATSAIVANWDNLSPAEQELLAMPEVSVRIDEKKASTIIAGADVLYQNQTLFTTGMLGLILTDTVDNRDVAYISLKGSVGYNSDNGEKQFGFAGAGASVSFRVGDIGIATIEGSYTPMTGVQAKAGVRLAVGKIGVGTKNNTIPLQESSYTPNMKMKSNDTPPSPTPPTPDDEDKITYSTDKPSFAGQQNDNVSLGNGTNNSNVVNNNSNANTNVNESSVNNSSTANTSSGSVSNNNQSNSTSTPATTNNNNNTGFNRQKQDNRTLGL